jgi:hypothetical protein
VGGCILRRQTEQDTQLVKLFYSVPF